LKCSHIIKKSLMLRVDHGNKAKSRQVFLHAEWKWDGKEDHLCSCMTYLWKTMNLYSEGLVRSMHSDHFNIGLPSAISNWKQLLWDGSLLFIWFTAQIYCFPQMLRTIVRGHMVNDALRTTVTKRYYVTARMKSSILLHYHHVWRNHGLLLALFLWSTLYWIWINFEQYREIWNFRIYQFLQYLFP